MRRIIVIIFSLLVVSSLSAQTLSYETVRNTTHWAPLPTKSEIRAYHAIDGTLYQVGDVLKIGDPSFDQITVVQYAFIDGPMSFKLGNNIGLESGRIEYFYLKKAVDFATPIKAKQQEQIQNQVSYGEVNMSGAEKTWIVYAKVKSGKTTLNVQMDNALVFKEILGKDEQMSAPVQSLNGSQIKPSAVESAQNNFFYGQSNVAPTNEAQAFEPARRNFFRRRANDVDPSDLDRTQRKGYGGMVMMDFGFDAYSVGLSLGVSMVNGYHFNSNWYVGGGIGVLLSAGVWDFTFGIPIFAYGQYTFNSIGRIQPYVSLGAGTNIEFTYLEGGIYCTPAGGILVKMKNNKQHVKIGVSVPMDFLHVIGFGLQVGYSF